MERGRSIKESLAAAVSDTPWQRAVVKACDSANKPTKRKHLETLLRATFRQDVPVSDICEGLISKAESKSSSWTSVVKALTVLHRLLQDGHERFGMYATTRSGTLNLANFRDLKTTEGQAMSYFIRSYAEFLNTKIRVDRALGFDICHVKAKEKMTFLKSETGPKLVETIQQIQELTASIDTFYKGLKGAVATGVDPLPGMPDTLDYVCVSLVSREPMCIILQDALRFFVTQNDAMVNILERYFSLTKSNAASSYQLYDRFSHQCQEIDQFVALCRRHDLLEGKEVPELATAPLSILPSMKAFLDNYGANPQSASSNALAPGQQQQQRQQVEHMQKQATHFATLTRGYHQEAFDEPYDASDA